MRPRVGNVGFLSYADDVPVLFDDALNGRSGEDVQVDDAADGRVGEGGQRLNVDIHGVGIEQELPVKICLSALGRFEIDMKWMNA